MLHMSYLRVLRRTVPSFFFLHYCTVRGIAKDPKRCFPFMALVGFDSISGHTFSYYETYCCYCRCQGTHITRSEKHIFCDSSCYCWQLYLSYIINYKTIVTCLFFSLQNVLLPLTYFIYLAHSTMLQVA